MPRRLRAKEPFSLNIPAKGRPRNLAGLASKVSRTSVPSSMDSISQVQVWPVGIRQAKARLGSARVTVRLMRYGIPYRRMNWVTRSPTLGRSGPEICR